MTADGDNCSESSGKGKTGHLWESQEVRARLERGLPRATSIHGSSGLLLMSVTAAALTSTNFLSPPSWFEANTTNKGRPKTLGVTRGDRSVVAKVKRQCQGGRGANATGPFPVSVARRRQQGDGVSQATQQSSSFLPALTLRSDTRCRHGNVSRVLTLCSRCFLPFWPTQASYYLYYASSSPRSARTYA